MYNNKSPSYIIVRIIIKQIKKDSSIKKSLLYTKKILGNFLFSHSLSSALSGLTSVFGMGTGVPHLLLLPRKYIEK